ncbi:hypothetical protein [Myroides fluvii]|uniref:hypothetical protein n=1 Tax=Myroides fluvii TaxID=2572594 RepID=UPI00131D5D05|nr:hypothetical protein [Myroides fluvii]
MSVASINVGFQVNVKELADKLNQAAVKLEQHKAKFDEIGSSIGQAGMYIGRYVDQMAGTVITTIGGVVSFIPEIMSGIAKLNAVIAANPWIALATVITAAGTALYFFTRKGSEAAQMQKMLNDVNTEALKNTAKERAELDSLLLVAQDENALKKDRLDAIKKLNEISPQYLGNINLETINTKEATDAIGKYINALNSKAREQALMAKKTQLYQEQIEEEAKSVQRFQANADALSRIYGGQAGVIIRTKEQLEDYIKELSLSKQQAAEFREEYSKQLGVLEKGREKYESKIAVLNDYVKAEGLANGAVDASSKVHENSDKAISEKIKTLRSEREVLDRSSSKYKELTADIERYEAMLSKANKPKAPIIKTPKTEKREKATVAAVDFSPVIAGSTAEMEKQIKTLERQREAIRVVFGEANLAYQSLTNQIKDIEFQIKIDVDESSLNTSQFKSSFDNFQSYVEGQAQLSSDVIRRKQEEAQIYANLAGDSFAAFGSSFVQSMGEAENGLEQFGQAMAEAVVKIIAMGLSQSVSNSVVIGTETAKGFGPMAAFVLPGLIAAAMGAVMSAHSQVPKFADGGIVYGPTLGLMGEYAGATRNPEVIAPLDKLKNLIKPAGGGETQIFLGGRLAVSGGDLKLILDRHATRSKRIGG